MKTKLLFSKIQSCKNSILSLLIIFLMTATSFSQESGIEFVFDCNAIVKFGQPDISGTYFVYPEGTAFDGGGSTIQMNWFVVYEPSLNRWELKGPTTTDGSGTPVTFFVNNSTAAFPSDNVADWGDAGAGGGFPCTLINITYTGSSGDPDSDGDGFPASVDCNDNDAAVNPSATEVPYDGKDNDCDPATLDDDLDQDGVINAQDCDDNDPDRFPGNPDVCDGIDNDCDGEVDEDDPDCNNGVILEYCNDAKTKVLVCHNGKDICVSINALPAHEAHGDYLGSCANAREGEVLVQERPTSYDLVSWPNPTNDLFNVRMRTPNYEDTVSLKAFDINGRLIYTDKINANEDYQFGYNLQAGIYFIKVTQAENTQVIKVIKQ